MTGNHTGREARETDRIELTDEGVTVRKLVSKGERLEIDRGDARITLDALLLEALAWQSDVAAIDALLGDGRENDPVAQSASVADESGDPITIANEYAQVTVKRVSTPAGDGIEVTTPGRGTSIVLGPPSLRTLAGVEDTTVFSVWFKTPFGPEDTPVEGPL